MTATISLAEASERLGVHYMTAYRYVRTGRLPAHKEAGQWHVAEDDLTSFISNPNPSAPRRDAIPERLFERLIAGDEFGAFQLLEAAMASGADAEELYLDFLSPVLTEIGRRWHEGKLAISEEHLATATAIRVIARIGPRIASRGRSRGTVILAGVSDDYHSLPTALLRDLLRCRAYNVVDLGANTPPESIVDQAMATDELVAIGIASTNPGNDDIVKATISTIRERLDTPVIVGGGAFRDAEHIRSLGDCLPSMSARDLLELVDGVHAAKASS